MATVSIITPVATYHRGLITRCADSVSLQTVRCEHIVIDDTDWHGAGFCRNRGIERATSDFIVFLDADDSIEPDFVERCLDVWTPGSYVYTDWWRGLDIIEAPDRPWRADGSWHVITALIPTQAVIEADGFDENVSGGEDSIFYWTLTRNDCCGIHLQEPLFHYGHEGQRAKAFVDNPLSYAHWKETLLGRFKYQMGCCGDANDTPPDLPGNEPFEGAVLVRATWDGNRHERGIVSRRLYERTGNYKQIWVDARDVAAQPNLWQVISDAASEPKRLNIPQAVALNGSGRDASRFAHAQHVQPAPLIQTVRSIQEVTQRIFPDIEMPADITAMKAIEPSGRGDVGQVLRLARL